MNIKRVMSQKFVCIRAKCDDLPIFHPNDEVINGNQIDINKRFGALQLIHSIILKP